MSQYRKFLVAIASALAVLSASLPDGVSSAEWIAVALAALGALGVYAVPND
jgi:hypothetical protein